MLAPRLEYRPGLGWKLKKNYRTDDAVKLPGRTSSKPKPGEIFFDEQNSSIMVVTSGGEIKGVKVR